MRRNLWVLVLAVGAFSAPGCASRTAALREKETRQGGGTIHLPLLVLVITEKAHSHRRAWQRDTWLSAQWQAKWRYVYVQSRSQNSTSLSFGHIVGDVVTLRCKTESYANLVYKTLATLRWALARVWFKAALKTDDDSMVHIDRVSRWLEYKSFPLMLYAGRVFRDSQVIRTNFSRRDLLHPEWFPDDFQKWAVPYELYDAFFFPPYCSGAGYLLGPSAAANIVQEYDARRLQAQSVIQLEDVYLGILARERGIVPLDISTLISEPPVHQIHTSTTYLAKILVHRVSEPRRAFLWLLTDDDPGVRNAHVPPPIMRAHYRNNSSTFHQRTPVKSLRCQGLHSCHTQRDDSLGS
mmetsp:Transcript_4834/g.10716  ORF Transcript_4834/g.10716 Transcript_4834/m.10716 type:complete len:352 (+) Transcript_4834:1-1056(+)